MLIQVSSMIHIIFAPRNRKPSVGEKEYKRSAVEILTRAYLRDEFVVIGEMSTAVNARVSAVTGR